MAPTVREILGFSNISNLADATKKIDLGAFIEGQIPRWVTKTALSSAATQIHYGDDLTTKQPFQVHAVTLEDDTPLAMIAAGAVGAGEVKVELDADGVPTFTFNAAVTGYKVMGCPIPPHWSKILAAGLAVAI